MSSKTLNFSDHVNPTDTFRFEQAKTKPGFRTQILGGYDPYVDEHGVTQLGETLFDTENSMVLGGALFTLEKIFGVASPLTVDTLNNIMNIATTGVPINETYPRDTVVCLFGVGIGGSGETIASVKDVKFQEREVMDMIPFRVTDSVLSASDADKYWFKRKDQTTGKTSYFLKKFEATPQIKVLWKDAEGDADGSSVETGVHNTTRTEPIETFVELNLKVAKNDCREYFELNGNVEQTRVNSIGLFTGIRSQLDDGTYDFKQVKLFSKLNINNEMLTLAKDLTVIYRVYTS